jgi:prepilin-type N-terminal cleavage/methylation domain-containing protein
MRRPRRRPPAFSLPEVLVVLTLLGVVTALALPRFASLRDGAAVRAASAETARTFASAREYAVLRRSAVAVVIDTVRSAIELRSAGQSLMRRELGATYRVVLATNRDSAVYDARGLGYGASNLSLVLRRGKAADTFVVSRLGRTRW